MIDRTPSADLSVSRHNMPAPEAAGGAAASPDGLPGWDLTDLYPAMDSPALARDLEQAASDAESFAARYQGRLTEIAKNEGSAGLYRVLTEFEALQDLMGRIGSFAYLNYVTKTDDPARAKFFGDMQEKLTNIGSKLLFFGLELNRIDDAVMEAAMAAPPLSSLQALAGGGPQGEALSARRRSGAAVPRKGDDRPRRLEPSVQRDDDGAALRDRRRKAADRADPEFPARIPTGRSAPRPARRSPRCSRPMCRCSR